MPTILKVSAVLVVGLFSTACAQQPVAVVEPICGSIRTVWVSKDDKITERTSTQIEGNNLAREKLCGRSRPPARTEPKTS